MKRATAVVALLLTAVSFATAELVVIGTGLGEPGGSTPWAGC
jgi:hypothetical protein